MAGAKSYADYRFDFEKLNVYQKALEFTNGVFSLTRNFGRELQYSLGDQFRRSASSICNNLAEGSRKSQKSRRQFYHCALDSARECIPMITLAVMQREVSRDQEVVFRDQAIHICNMIYRLIESS